MPEHTEKPKSTLNGLHAIAYTRVSTKDKGQTIKTQENHIKQWADTYGVTIDAWFSDVGKSGDEWPRPQLSMAILTLNLSPSAVILVSYSQSRLTRNASEDLPEIKKLLKDGALIRYSEYGDDDPDTLGSKMRDAVTATIDSAELDRLHERTRAGMETRKKAGKHIGRPAKVIITDNPGALLKGVVQERDGTLTKGTDPNAEDRQRHYKPYPRGTKILTKSEVLNYARMGWTPYKVSKILGISPASFIRIMSSEDVDIYDEYRAILAQVKGASA